MLNIHTNLSNKTNIISKANMKIRIGSSGKITVISIEALRKNKKYFMKLRNQHFRGN